MINGGLEGHVNEEKVEDSIGQMPGRWMPGGGASPKTY